MSAPSLLPQHNLQVIPWADLEVGSLIGEGGFAEVYKGKWRGKDIAIKKLTLKKLPAYLAKDFDKETKIMAQCNQCPQIVKLFGVCMEGQYAMILDFMEKGSLFDILHDEDVDLPWIIKRFQIAIDVGKGLSYLHNHEILHRDLKSHNILLDGDFNAKITDFGLSKLKLESSSRSKEDSAASKKAVGTLRWHAPELHELNPTYSKESDVYAYGMILWEIASRKIPFGNASETVIVSSVKEGKREIIPPDCPQEYAQLIQRSWLKEPGKRPSSQYIVMELEKLLPKPGPKSWHFDPETKVLAEGMGKEFALIEATAKDVDKVMQFYSHHPVPGYDIASVNVVYNPSLHRRFSEQMKLLQKRHGSDFFNPNWSKNLFDELVDWRQKVHEMFEELAKPYTDPDYPDVKLLPLWHGGYAKAIESICQVGYSNPTATDAGFFGRGLYGAYEADYSNRVYCKGAFFLNWVAIYSAYPVVLGDESKLAAKGNFENYDAHFIPVIPRHPDNPHEVIYDACTPFTPHTYTEVVVFESAACLPRYLVKLQPLITKTLSVAKQDQSSVPTTPKDQFQFGLRYYKGEGVPQDYDRAFKYFKLVADQGIAEAQFNVGLCYTKGKGVKQDYDKAFKYYKLAAEQGRADAEYCLGVCYEKGYGVKQNYETAIKCYKKASHKNDIKASKRLGECYLNGQGGVKDLAQAVKYLQRAVDLGDLDTESLLVRAKQELLNSMIPAMAFGKKEWEKYFGDIGVEPPLPPDIDQILQSPCPFWPGKKVHETHLLTLIPKTVNGKPLTLISLEELVKAPKQGNATQYRDVADSVKKEHGNTQIESSYWVLMTRDVIEGSRNKSFSEQQKLISNYSLKANVPYKVPTILDACVGIFMEYIRTGIRLYPDIILTRCEEKYYAETQLAVGCFAPGGLYVTGALPPHYAHDEIGVMGFRKLAAPPIQASPMPAPASKPLPSPKPPAPSASIKPPVAIVTPVKGIPKVPKRAFGKAAWEKYFGDIGVEPPLPPDIDQILQSPCPFWPGKKVHETHLLTLIPKTVNGKPLTLISLEELVKAPKQGNATKYRYVYDSVKKEHGNTQIESSYWVLMTRDVIEGSRSKTYEEQCQLVESTAKRTGLPLALPKAIEAAVSILMHYVRTKEYLYKFEEKGKFADPTSNTCTRCQEKVDNNTWAVVIGSFTRGGLFVSNYASYCYADIYVGVAGFRRFV